MTIVGRTIKDGDVISIVRKFLVSGVMIDDEYEDSVIGTPQGGNISPLLANIMLNELDKEMEERGLDFVRYADDCIIMVGSELAANRVMNSISKFIEEKLGLKVNVSKSKVDKPKGIKYLGFGFYYDSFAKQYKAKPHEKSVEKFKARMKELTCRSWGVDNAYKIKKLNQLTRGWINYFKIGSMKGLCKKLDSNIRYRLRMCIWKHWKTPQNRAKNLIKLGIPRWASYRTAYNGACIARVCSMTDIQRAISPNRLKDFGLISMIDYYTEKCTC
jgi:group II intron reverse transcriptase/maturase